jgi:hypothetical protein
MTRQNTYLLIFSLFYFFDYLSNHSLILSIFYVEGSAAFLKFAERSETQWTEKKIAFVNCWKPSF